MAALAVVIERIHRKNGDIVCEVNPVVPTINECVVDGFFLLRRELKRVGRQGSEPEVIDVVIEVKGVFLGYRVVMVLRIIVAKNWHNERVWELDCHELSYARVRSHE